MTGTSDKKESLVAVVTGAASPTGIGAGIARRLASRGYSTVLVDIDEAVKGTAIEIADDLGLPRHRVVPFVASVTDEVQMKAAISDAAERFGRIDVAVANAGGGGTEVEVVDMATEEFDRIVILNLRGTFLTCKTAGAVMKRAGRGSIITISSIYALEPSAKTAPYAAGKAGIIAMTYVLAKELAPFGVRVNSIAPGYIETASLVRTEEMRAVRLGISLDAEWARVNDMVPLGGRGAPVDIAAAVEFLASDEARYITGQTLGVNGGLVMR